MTTLLERARREEDLSRDDLIQLLSTPKAEQQELFDSAYAIKEKYVGKTCYFRGIIELSNICSKDCYYCGIRKSNKNTERFRMERNEILDEALWAHKQNYGSLVMQSGEIQSEEFTTFIEEVLLEIKERSNDELGITLSLGEQTEETYQRWFNAGAHRYLLRIETSNKELYGKLHPADHDFDIRVNCLKLLRKVGYQVGTGVMIGLPGQTTGDLADDLQFFKDIDIDMIGMGPYIPHDETPLAKKMLSWTDGDQAAQFRLGLKMVATARLFLRDVNIAATTALQALDPVGREKGLLAGANVIMPNLTDTQYRPSYQLYNNKPCLDENSTMCRGCLSKRIGSIGETIGLGEWGDSPHYASRTKESGHSCLLSPTPHG